MAFTTWAALRTDIKDKIESHVADGKILVGSYSIGNKTLTYQSLDDLMELYERTYVLERIESADTIGAGNQAVSYGRHRRYP